MKEKKIDLGFCPRCKEKFHEGRMTRTISKVRFCYLCSFDLEEEPAAKQRWIEWAKEYAEEML